MREVLTIRGSVDARIARGGTATEAVRAQLEELLAAGDQARTWASCAVPGQHTWPLLTEPLRCGWTGSVLSVTAR